MTTTEELISFGARPFKAKWVAKYIDGYKPGDELKPYWPYNDDPIYQVYLSVMSPVEAVKQRVYDWGAYDKEYPHLVDNVRLDHLEGKRVRYDRSERLADMIQRLLLAARSGGIDDLLAMKATMMVDEYQRVKKRV